MKLSLGHKLDKFKLLLVEIGFFHRAMGKHLRNSHIGGLKVSWQDLLKQKQRKGLGTLPQTQPVQLHLTAEVQLLRTQAHCWTYQAQEEGQTQSCHAISRASKASVVQRSLCCCPTHLQLCALSHTP